MSFRAEGEGPQVCEAKLNDEGHGRALFVEMRLRQLFESSVALLTQSSFGMTITAHM